MTLDRVAPPFVKPSLRLQHLPKLLLRNDLDAQLLRLLPLRRAHVVAGYKVIEFAGDARQHLATVGDNHVLDLVALVVLESP